MRLTWQKTHYQMSWRRTNIFRKRFTNEMSLQNIKEKKLVVTQNITKNIYICLVSTFSTLNNINFFAFFFFCCLFFSKNTLWRKEKKLTAMVRHRKRNRSIKKREAALRQKTETCCTQPQNQRTQIQVQQKANITNQG